MNEIIREKLIDIILKVAMAHHDDISKADEDAACDAADEILKIFSQIPLWLWFLIWFVGFTMGTGMVLFLLEKF